MEANRAMNLSRYLFSSFNMPDVLAASEITVSTAAALILGSSCSVSWFSLALSATGLFLGVFLVAMLTISLQVSSKRKEVAVMRALGAKQSSILRVFLLRVALLTILGCLLGTAMGYCIASTSAEYSLLSTEVVGGTLLVSSISSFSGGSVAVRRILHFRVAEVLRC
jgi:ABC-type antimicrobial peptide transport system permease subunit